MHGQKLNKRQIPLYDKIGYGIGNLSYGIIFQMIGTYLVFYSTAVLGIPGSLVGMAVSISVFWDAISDPLMGYFSDITNLKRFGRRHIYILIGSIAMAIFNILLWAINPEWSGLVKFIWVFIDLIFIKSCITIYSTPYTALGAELTNDYNERTSIQSTKTVFFLLGLMFATVAGMFLFFNPTPAYPIGQLNPAAYRNMGITSSIMAIVFGMICFFTTKKYIPFLPTSINKNIEINGIKSLIKSFTVALKNEYYKYIVFGYLFTNTSSALISSLGLHVFTYTFGLDNSDIAIVFGVQFAISILSQPIWLIISKKIDKKPTMIVGLLISAFASVIFIGLVLIKSYVYGNFIYMIPFVVIIGFGTGGLFSLPFSMVADTIDVEELSTGIRSEGIYYGCLTLAYKLSQSITIFLLGILLDIVKFDSNADTQSEFTVVTLGFTIALGSLIGFGAAIWNYYKYTLNKDKILDIQDKIQMKDKMNKKNIL